MSTETVYNAVKARLISALGGAYPVRDWEEIEQDLQQSDAPFLALDGGSGLSELRSIGQPDSNFVEDSGTVIVHAFVPSSGPLGTARGIGDQIRQVLQFQYLPVPDGQQLRCTTADPPSQGVIHDGLWHSMMIAVDYQHTYAVATAAE